MRRVTPTGAHVQALRVLWVADGFDGSYRYRCMQGVAQLRLAGVAANVMHLDDPGLLAALPSYSVVILFRLEWSERVAAVAAAARDSGATLVFEIDDLVFDPSVEPLLPFLPDLPDAERREYRRRFRRLRRTFDACDVFLGSTPPLARLAEALGKPALVHPNLVSPRYERIAGVLRRLGRGRRTPPSIAYVSGSNTHDRDLAVVSGALGRIMGEDPGVRLFVCGFVELPPDLARFADRVVQVPYQDWRVYPWALAGCAAAVAPMSAVNAFTDGKSVLKFFEAGVFGVPAIATPTEAFRDAIRDGDDGFLAADEAEWAEKIRRALDRAEGPRVGARARATVLDRFTFAAHRGRLAALLAPLAGRAVGPAPPLLSVDPDRRGMRRVPGPGRTERVRRIVAFLRGGVPDEPRAVRGAPRTYPLDPAPFDRVLAAAATYGAAWLRETGPVLRHLAADAPQWERWSLGSQLERAEDGTLHATGDDPLLLGPRTAIPPGDFRYLVLRMATRSSAAAPTAQVFWATDEDAFVESASVRWTIDGDGAPRTWVMDLHDAGWPSAGTVVRFRLDPLDVPGAITLLGMTLVADLAQLEDDDARAALVARHPGARIVDAPDAEAVADRLRLVAGALAPEAAVIVAVAGAGDGVRTALGTAASRLDLAVEEFAPGPGGACAVLRRRPAAEPAEAATPARRPTDVVVPIYDARAEVTACLASVRRHATGDWRLVAVDDASPDPALRADLDALAAADARVRVLRNPENRGFVHTANRGLAAAEGRDVLLLNSDTVVTAGFLERLQAAAYASDPPAIVSPLSNHATILSVPAFCRGGPVPEGWSVDEFGALVRDASLGTRVELPSAHGFCMYVPAAVIAAIGLLDEASFGRGFGEENDYCERARAAGFASRATDDVFVYHAGGASFGDAAGDALKTAHYETLRRLHPDYFPRVARFIETNPLAPVQRSVELAVCRRTAGEPALLCLLHASFDVPGGGTEHHVRDLVRALALPRVVVAVPQADGLHVTEVAGGDLAGALRFRMPLAEPPVRFMLDRPDVAEAVRAIVRVFGVGAVHMHQLSNWPVSVWRTLAALRIPYVATFQDFFPVCPNVNLVDVPSERPCCLAGDASTVDRVACLTHTFRVFGQSVPDDPLAYRERHRAEFAALLERADAVFCPAGATRDILAAGQRLPERVHVVPHGYPIPAARARPRADRRPVHVALLGEVAYPIKGARRYPPLLAETRDLPIAWHVFGEAERFGFGDALRAIGLGERLVLHGGYRRDDIVERLAAAEIDLVVFLPPWPETFSYTLSEALTAGVPVVVSDEGALAERVRASGAGLVVRTVDEAVSALERLVGVPSALAALQEAAQRYRHRTVDEMAADYRPRYQRLLAAAPRPPALARGDRRRLVEWYDPGEVTASGAALAEPTTVPLPHYRQQWYPWYLAVAGLVPEGARRWAKERVAARWWQTVRAFRFAGNGVRANDGLRLVRQGGGAVVYDALHDDPSFEMPAASFSPRQIRVVRFAMRHDVRGPAYAQLYWRHEGDDDFSEDKSVRVSLEAADGRWHDYTILIDGNARAREWEAGEEIRGLRFDPLNVRGTVELRDLKLCARNG